MVLYKRKQVTFVRPPEVPSDLSTEIFIIPQTKEWFIEYEDYLNRMDYYHRRKFVCEITGNSCLTFFEAFDSELKEIKDVEKNFPEALREHILRFLQFNRISRLDQLVDKVYLVFKNEYFPGEEVYVKNPVATNTNNAAKVNDEQSFIYVSTIKQKGIIREKVQYSNPFDTKYLVATMNDDRQIIATNEQISRDRNHFTKWLIKTFVKLTVTRSHKVGAPWVVKEKYAKKYRIPNEYPEDLKHFESSTPTGNVLYEDEIERSVTPMPPTDSKGKKQREKQLKKKATLNAASTSSHLFDGLLDEKDMRSSIKNGTRQRFLVNHLPAAILRELKENELATLSSFQPSKKTIVEDLNLDFDLQTYRPCPKKLSMPENAKLIHQNSQEKVQQDINNIEEVDAKQNNSTETQDDYSPEKTLQFQELNCIQEALECWTFLNIYHSVLNLDTFTFDDFLCAMSWNAEQFQNIGRCELLDEIWCAVLCGIMSNEQPKKNSNNDESMSGLLINLPPKTIFAKSGEEKSGLQEETRHNGHDQNVKVSKADSDTSEVDTGESKVPHTLSANGAMSKEDQLLVSNEHEKEDVEANEENEENEENEDLSHNAYSVMNHRGIKWYERLRKRNFKDGNWQTILLGVLSLVEYVPSYQDTINQVFNTLAPALSASNTPSSVLSEFYTNMSVNLRLKTLRILTSLLVNGSLVRNYIDESLDACAALRRSRLDIIRDLKAAVDEANKIHSSLHEKLLEAATKASESKIWAQFNKKKPRFNTKSYEMTDYERELSESDESFQTLWKNRDEAIEKIKALRISKKDVETKFTEMDCQRVRLLGKDRLFNRYWWFENNGLPNLHFTTEGDEDEEAEAESDDDDEEKEDMTEETYLMGKLWVQGPSSMDLLTNLKLSESEISLIERKLRESTREQDREELNPKNKQSNGDKQENTVDLGDGGTLLQVMDFNKLPDAFIKTAEVFGVKYSANSISVNEKKIIDRVGGIPKDEDVTNLLPIQRKFIEEAPEPLVSGDQWRFYDKPEQIDLLIKWLNPWGKRESQLRKELLRVKEGLIASINGRRKALWLDQLPKEVLEIQSNIDKVSEKILGMQQNASKKSDSEDSGDELMTRKRSRRSTYTPNKRQKTMEEAMKSGTLEELLQLKVQLHESLEEKVAENHTTRVLEWINSTTRENFDRSLYEGGDKPRPRAKRPKK